MSAEETRLAIALAAGPAAATLLGALLLLVASAFGGRPWRWLVWPAGFLLALALGAAGGALVLSALAPPGTATFDVPLYAWSPLGLYGVTFVLRPSPAGAVLCLPPLVLALAGWLRRVSPRRRTVAGHATNGRAGDAAALVAIAGALWTGVAGDLVTQYLGVTLFLLGTVGALWAVAGDGPAGGRLVLTGGAGLSLLFCVLTLGKVNGLFALSQLSTAGFTDGAFLGLALGAATVAAAPFHAWLLRLARHPYGPSLAAAGVGTALALLLGAFRTTAGALPPGWAGWLVVYGWLATLATLAIALRRGTPALRLGALFAGKAGLLFFATAIATPVSMAAAVLYATVTLPALGLLWWLAAAPPGRGAESAAPAVGAGPRPRHTGPPLWRHPGFWLLTLILASAAALPGTAGGAAGGAFVRALTSWPSGDLTLRVPPFLLDAAVLVVGGGLLWASPEAGAGGAARRGRRLPLLRLTDWRGWLLLIPLAVLVVAPAVLPGRLVGQWYGPIAAAAAGTGTAPLTLDLSRVPPVLSAILGLLALWVLVQRLRGKEWLPGPLPGLVGIAALLVEAATRAWRRAGVSTAPARWVGTVWTRLQGAADRVMGALRPFEERYYAAAAVMVAVALIYIIGR